MLCVFILRYLTVLLLWYNPHYTYPISYTAPIFDINIDIDINIDFDSESLISITKSRRKWNAKWNCSFGLGKRRRRKRRRRWRPCKDCWLYLIYILYTKLFIYTESIIHAYPHAIYNYTELLYLYYHIDIDLLWQLCVQFQASLSIKQSYHISLQLSMLYYTHIHIYIVYSIYNSYNEHHLQGAATGHILTISSFCFLCCCCNFDFTRNRIISTKLAYTYV